MSVISGSLRKLAIRRGGTSGSWEDVAHIISDSWNTQTDFAETTTRENNGFKSFIPTALSSTIEASGLIFQDSDLTGKIGYKTLKEVQEAFEKVEYRLQILNEDYTYYGNMYVANVGDAAEVSGLLEYSISFQLTDKPVLLGDNQAPTAPLLSVTDTDIITPSVSLSWTVSTDDVGVVGYEMRKADSTTQTIFDLGNVNEWTDFGVMQLGSYSYNVRAYDAAGNYSEWSNKKFVVIRLPLGPGEQKYPILQEDGNLILTEDNVTIIREG